MYRFQELREQKLKDTQLLNGQTSPSSEEEKLKIMGLDVSMWEDHLCEEREKSFQHLCEVEAHREELHQKDKQAQGEDAKTQPQAHVVIREKTRPFDDSNMKTRAKRESRRMRELEQAKFSLELLKVRATGGTSPSEDRRWSGEFANDGALSPQGTPDSQSSKGSFELVTIDDYAKEKCDEAGEFNLSFSASPQHEVLPSSPKLKLPPEPPAPTIVSNSPKAESDNLPALPKLENSLPTFYIPPVESSSVCAKSIMDAPISQQQSPEKPVKNRKESFHKPVVVVISMQKESMLDAAESKSPEQKDSFAQTSESPSPGQGESPTRTMLERLEKLNEAKQERQKHQQQQNEKEMMEQIRLQKDILEKQRKHFAQYEKDMFEKQRDKALQMIEQSRQESSGKATDRNAPIAQPEPDLISQQTQDRQDTSSKTREKPKDKQNVSDGWAPKLILESQESAAKEAPKKPPTSIVNINMTERHGDIFFSPKDKVLK